MNSLQKTPLRLAVVQASPFCNIDCKYCYLPDRSQRSLMSQETVIQMAEFLFSDVSRLRDGLTILWHGGEPTAVPIGFYEAALQTIADKTPLGVSVTNRFSTNATLINDQWCEFIRKWGVTVRVSVDGPRDIHDANRVYRGGLGTFDHVLRGIECLNKHNIPFDVISTVSRISLDNPEKIWRFYRQIGAKALHFCVEEVLAAHAHNSLAEDDSFHKVEVFFAKFLELRDLEAPDLYIRELDELIQGLPKLTGHVYRDESVPLMIVSVAWNGDISTFSPELLVARHIRYGNFVFGNVATSSLDEIGNSYKMHLVYKHIRDGIDKCRSQCDYFKICGGGCPAAKVFESGSFAITETLSCRLRIKAVGNVVLEHLNLPHFLGRVE